MAEKLFDDFQGIGSKQWKQQIQYELKGTEYNDLIWESAEGIKVKPFYHRDEQLPVHFIAAKKPFAICQEIFVYDVEKSVRRAIDSINRGADEIRFIIQDKEIDILKLLADISADRTIYIELSFLNDDFPAQHLSDNVHLLIDPIANLASDGNWFNSAEDISKISKLKNLSVDGRIYQNAGANMVQQLAYSLAHAVEYLNASANSSQMIFQMATGSNYFFEIAKLRALRLLYALVAKEFGISTECKIIASPSKRNKTLYDYNVNMLRTTTECMSAILGGADSIQNLPYDAIYHKSNEFGERIARNQLLVLKHESYFDRTLNAADGSYYIENLTQQLAEKALTLFKEIEQSGGFLKLLYEGTIQRKISESAAKEQALFDSGKEILVGTNKYPNKNDRMADELELFPFVKVRQRKTTITPIIERRLSEKYEQDRLQSEKS